MTRFVRDGDEGSREVVLVRETETELEMALVLPPESKRISVGGALDDVWLQVAEGVSHFILFGRARAGIYPSTQLELELQAEVDKIRALARVSTTESEPNGLLASAVRRPAASSTAEGSEAGARYSPRSPLGCALCVPCAIVANDRSSRARTAQRSSPWRGASRENTPTQRGIGTTRPIWSGGTITGPQNAQTDLGARDHVGHARGQILASGPRSSRPPGFFRPGRGW